MGNYNLPIPSAGVPQGPAGGSDQIARLIQMLQQHHAAQRHSHIPPPQWQGYAHGGGVHNTGDPHLDSALDEVHAAATGAHPDPEGAAMNYAHLLLPGSMDNYQHSGSQQPGAPDIGSLLASGADDQGGGGMYSRPDGGGQDVHEGAVQGSDGGMDDSVDAQSDGGEPVKLSHGEYVIPADVVSMLGDGNTDAGVAMLDQFLGQVREQKYGKDQQPEQTPDDVFDSLQPGEEAGEGGEEPPGQQEQEEPSGGQMPPAPPPGLPPEQQEPPGAPSGMAAGGDVLGDYVADLHRQIAQNDQNMSGFGQQEQAARRPFLQRLADPGTWSPAASPEMAHLHMQQAAEQGMANRRALAQAQSGMQPGMAAGGDITDDDIASDRQNIARHEQDMLRYGTVDRDNNAGLGGALRSMVNPTSWALSPNEAHQYMQEAAQKGMLSRQQLAQDQAFRELYHRLKAIGGDAVTVGRGSSPGVFR